MPASGYSRHLKQYESAVSFIRRNPHITPELNEKWKKHFDYLMKPYLKKGEKPIDFVSEKYVDLYLSMSRKGNENYLGMTLLVLSDFLESQSSYSENREAFESWIAPIYESLNDLQKPAVVKASLITAHRRAMRTVDVTLGESGEVQGVLASLDLERSAIPGLFLPSKKLDPVIKLLQSVVREDRKLIIAEMGRLKLLKERCSALFADLRKEKTKVNLANYVKALEDLQKQSARLLLVVQGVEVAQKTRKAWITSFNTAQTMYHHVSVLMLHKSARTTAFSSVDDIAALSKLLQRCKQKIESLVKVSKKLRVEGLFILGEDELRTNPSFISVAEKGQERKLSDLTTFEQLLMFGVFPPFIATRKTSEPVLGEDYVDLTQMNPNQINRAMWKYLSVHAGRSVLAFALDKNKPALSQLVLRTMVETWELRKEISYSFTRGGKEGSATYVIRPNQEYKDQVNNIIQALKGLHGNVAELRRQSSDPEKLEDVFQEFFKEYWNWPEQTFSALVSEQMEESSLHSFMDHYRHYFMKYHGGDFIAGLSMFLPGGQAVAVPWFMTQGVVGYTVSDIAGDTWGKVTSVVLLATFALGGLAAGLGKAATVVKTGTGLSLGIKYSLTAIGYAQKVIHPAFVVDMTINASKSMQAFAETGKLEHLCASLSILLTIAAGEKLRLDAKKLHPVKTGKKGRVARFLDREIRLPRLKFKKKTKKAKKRKPKRKKEPKKRTPKRKKRRVPKRKRKPVKKKLPKPNQERIAEIEHQIMEFYFEKIPKALARSGITKLAKYLERIERIAGGKIEIGKLLRRGLAEPMFEILTKDPKVLEPQQSLSIKGVSYDICPVSVPNAGSGRPFSLIFVTKGGVTKLGLYYKSKSAGSWRLLPLREPGWYYKPKAGEEHLNLTWKVQRELDRSHAEDPHRTDLSSDDLSRLSPDLFDLVDTGEGGGVADAEAGVERTIFLRAHGERDSTQVIGLDVDVHGRKIETTLDVSNSSTHPNSGRVLGVWKAKSDIHGDVTKVALESNDGKFVWVLTVSDRMVFMNSVERSRGVISNYGLPVVPKLLDPLRILLESPPYEYSAMATRGKFSQFEIGLKRAIKRAAGPEKALLERILTDYQRKEYSLENRGNYEDVSSFLKEHPLLRDIQEPLRVIASQHE